MLSIAQDPIIQPIQDDLFTDRGIEVFIKREDLIHPTVSGNKWRKLKYNLEQAKNEGHDTLLTFGGAYSNHIYATAAAAKETGFKSIGIIRGEEHLPLNPTLAFASSQGMQLRYMDRTTYRSKTANHVIDNLKNEFGAFYLIPEGGTNTLAIRGAAEIVDQNVKKFDYLCVSVGTGGTICGLIKGMEGINQIVGFSSLKGDFLNYEVEKLLNENNGQSLNNWTVNTHYHFGGYAKVNDVLRNFMKGFESKQHFLLDPVYTAKMMYGIYDLAEKGFFKKGSKVLAIHTGGLQGRF